MVMFNIVSGIVDFTLALIIAIIANIPPGIDLHDIPFNLTLFSETPIIASNVYDILIMFFTIFYSMFFIVLLYKVTKKIIKKVFGVFKL